MKRAVREIIVGTVLAVAMGTTATAFLSHDPHNQPIFNSGPTDRSGASLDNASGAARGTARGTAGDTGTGTRSGTGTRTIGPRSARTSAERRLLRTYDPFVIARQGASAYSNVTLPELGKQFPTIGFIPGDHLAQSSGEVSVSVPTPESLVLATRDGSGCLWLHELGGGPEVAHMTSPQNCAAATPPIDGWEPIAST